MRLVGTGRRKIHFLPLTILWFVMIATYAGAQQTLVNDSGLTIPDDGTAAAPDRLGPPAEVQPPIQPIAPPHSFWDRTNLWLFSGVAFVRAMDYASTRNFQARGRQEILLPNDVVNNSAGFAGLEAAATATSVGISYLFHRTGHHTLERWLSIGHIGVAGFGDVRNYCLKSRHVVH
jgi:hypothetical protein